MKHTLLFGLSLALAAAVSAGNQITVDAAKVKYPAAQDLWGIFFEDIDLSLDGGVYAELVRNRSFEDGAGKMPAALGYWKGLAGSQLAVTDEMPHSKINAHSMKVVAPAGGAVANEGYFGIAARKGIGYRLSVDVRGDVGALTVALESANGKTASTVATVTSAGAGWTTCKAELKGLVDDPNARLVFRSAKGGTFYLDCVTLFPSDTYGTSGLFRKDLMEKLAALKPSFVRFPGGCWVEGNTLAESYRWKKTIGSIWERPTQWNLWNYWSTHGVGFHEYLQICEDIGAKALFCINAGISHREIVPMEKMDEYVQDALDCIEYANGPATSKWGAVRAANGHPKPFNLAYLQIGNENGGKDYEARYELIAKAVHAKYPEIQLVFDGPWQGNDARNTWDTTAPKNLRDDHFYRSPDWFFDNDSLYANAQERRLGKRDFGIFVGEYAVTSVGHNHPYGTLRAAISEGAFMIGMENCSDVVKLAAYAPLFAHVKHLRWKPDLIYIAPGSSFVNPSYDVQKLFSENRGRDVLATTLACEPANTGKAGMSTSRFGVGSWKGAAAFRNFKITDAAGRVLYANDFRGAEALKGWKQVGGGVWTAKDGELVQSKVDPSQQAMSLSLDRAWPGDVTCTFQAKRIDGPEGFLALYGPCTTGASGNWVNFGGWENRWHGIEGAGHGAKITGSIEKGRWYNVTVTRRNGTVNATIDGVALPAARVRPSLYASAVTSPDGQEVIVKVVNGTDRAIAADVIVEHAKLAATAKLTTYTGPNPDMSNSLEHPTALKPVVSALAVGDGRIAHTFPACSLSVIRVKMMRAL